MNAVLLVMSAVADPSRAVARAVARAHELGGPLVAVALLDPRLTRRVGAALSNTGFVGEHVSEQVVDTLAREQRTLAETLLNQVREQAKTAGVALTALVESGDPEEVCRRITREHGVRCVVVACEKASWLARTPLRTVANRLAAAGACEVLVVGDES